MEKSNTSNSIISLANYRTVVDSIVTVVSIVPTLYRRMKHKYGDPVTHATNITNDAIATTRDMWKTYSPVYAMSALKMISYIRRTCKSIVYKVLYINQNTSEVVITLDENSDMRFNLRNIDTGHIYPIYADLPSDIVRDIIYVSSDDIEIYAYDTNDDRKLVIPETIEQLILKTVTQYGISAINNEFIIPLNEMIFGTSKTNVICGMLETQVIATDTFNVDMIPDGVNNIVFTDNIDEYIVRVREPTKRAVDRPIISSVRCSGK